MSSEQIEELEKRLTKSREDERQLRGELSGIQTELADEKQTSEESVALVKQKEEDIKVSTPKVVLQLHPCFRKLRLLRIDINKKKRNVSFELCVVASRDTRNECTHNVRNSVFCLPLSYLLFIFMKSKERLKLPRVQAMESRYRSYLEKARSVIKTLDPKHNNNTEVVALRAQVAEKDRLIKRLESESREKGKSREQEEKLLVSAWYQLGNRNRNGVV